LGGAIEVRVGLDDQIHFNVKFGMPKCSGTCENIGNNPILAAIPFIHIERDVKPTGDRSQSKFQDLKQCVQPFIIIVGETLDSITSSCLVIVMDKTL